MHDLDHLLFSDNAVENLESIFANGPCMHTGDAREPPSGLALRAD
jgi:hypothetical protein